MGPRFHPTSFAVDQKKSLPPPLVYCLHNTFHRQPLYHIYTYFLNPLIRISAPAKQGFFPLPTPSAISPGSRTVAGTGVQYIFLKEGMRDQTYFPISRGTQPDSVCVIKYSQHSIPNRSKHSENACKIKRRIHNGGK